MRVTLRPFSPTDLPLLSDWERAINAAQYMSRSRPKPNNLGPGDGPQPLWFVIEVDETPAGTLWLERGETLNEAALGILLGDHALFGRGIGQRAIACYERCGFKITRTSERQQREGSTFMYHTMILNLSSPIGPPIF